MLLRFTILVSLFSVCNLYAQDKFNNNWYFGNSAAIDFNSNPPTVKNDSKMNTYRSSAVVSDPKTGILLFYTNGTAFWNRFGELVDSNYNGTSVQDVLIIPIHDFKNRYMVVTFNRSYILDMEARGGRGAVIQDNSLTLRSTVNRMTAVKHCLSESYWLITIDGNAFCSYLVHPNGQIDPPVVSTNQFLNITNYLGDFVSSHNGEYLGVTSYTPQGNDYLSPLVFKFNKRCGTVENSSIILPIQAPWDRPHGISFSPNDQLVYVAYGLMDSHLVQYEVSNPGNGILVATSPQNFNQIACAPDGKLYITTHINGIPSNKLDVLLSPNSKGTACNYRENYLRVNGPTNFEVPNQIYSNSKKCSENSGFTLLGDTAICKGQTILFKLLGSQSGIDSIVWNFMDPNSIGKKVKGFETQHTYTSSGNFKPFAIVYACNNKDTFRIDVLVNEPVDLQLGNDTVLCAGDSLKIGDNRFGGPYKWNIGSTNESIVVKTAGTYIQNIVRPGCVSSDTIQIRYHPSLKTLLGDLYYICEEEQELVVLDAGKGYKTYVWFPTSDTSSWIEVSKRGNYYVVVSDYRGCKGKDESDVEGRCDLRVFYPNAFTPNADGLNDSLQVYLEYATEAILEVYNTWGELLFTGDAETGWDGYYEGNLVPNGVYMMRIRVRGFINKKAVENYYSSTVQVIY